MATEDIVRWIEEPNLSSAVLWVNGRAGVGISALMQRIAEFDGIDFGGCLFFRRGTPGCNVNFLPSPTTSQRTYTVDHVFSASLPPMGILIFLNQ
jgi:hypothetical protein